MEQEKQTAVIKSVSDQIKSAVNVSALCHINIVHIDVISLMYFRGLFFGPALVFGAERMMLLRPRFFSLRPLVSPWRRLLVIAAVRQHQLFAGGGVLQQQPLQHLLVRPLPTEIVFINRELQHKRQNQRLVWDANTDNRGRSNGVASSKTRASKFLF